MHHRQARNLPPRSEQNINPFFWFELLWPPELFELISRHTNHCAERYNKGLEETEADLPSQREWREMTGADIRIWIGIVVYMGLFPVSNVEEYWTSKDFAPQYPPTRYIS